jgi:RNA polymerase sigma factor (sigma-70 family)
MDALGENPLASDSPKDWDRVIQAVDPAALLLVVESRMGPEIRSTVMPEDILQEALLHAWRDRKNLEWHGYRAFRAWLLTIIDRRITEAVDHFGAQKRGAGRRHLPLNGNGVPIDSNGRTSGRSADEAVLATTTPRRMAVYREQADVMRQVLNTLPDDVREVLRLRLFVQQPLHSIAQAMGISESAVRRRLRKGAEIYYRRLRVHLASRASLAASWSGESAPGPATLGGADPSSSSWTGNP